MEREKERDRGAIETEGHERQMSERDSEVRKITERERIHEQEKHGSK